MTHISEPVVKGAALNPVAKKSRYGDQLSNAEYYTNLPLSSVLLVLWSDIDRRRKIQLSILFALMVVAGLAEVVSLGALVPFIGILVMPENLDRVKFVQEIRSLFALDSVDAFRLFITVVFCGSALVAGALRMVLYWATGKLSQLVRFDIETKVYLRTIMQPFQTHVNQHTSSIVDAIEKARVISRALMAVLNVSRGLIIGFSIIATLFVINAQIATFALLIIGGSYLLVSYLARWRLRNNSITIAVQQRSKLRILQESLGAIRDIILDGTHAYYDRLFRRSSLLVARSEAWNFFLRQSPRVVIEMIGMIILAAVAFNLSQGGDFVSYLPTLSALALGAQRMLPLLQQAYAGWAEVKGNQAVIGDVLALLHQPEPVENKIADVQQVPFRQSVEFRDVSFRYGDETPWIFEHLNLTIEKGARVGLVGKTGGGKSTILDLFMGLLTPTEGQILVDGVALAPESLAGWRMNIAHVPQAIFLADGTIAENIAFGTVGEKIDNERLAAVGKQAQVHEFVSEKLGGYEASVGERGGRLSGGQRQRIGIARALYKNTPVLVLDEATSALDQTTEEMVIHSIEQICEDITLLIVSHRESILRNCDVVYSLEAGKIQRMKERQPDLG